MGAPEAVAILGDSGGLTPRPREDLLRRMTAAAGRKDDPERAVVAARGAPAELFRISVADLTGQLDLDEVGRALTDLTAALIEVSLEVAIRSSPRATAAASAPRCSSSGWAASAGRVRLRQRRRRALRARALGERPEDVAQDQALEVVQELRRRLLGAQGPDPQLGLDADLRPEGKSGPLVRSLESYRSYYQRWSLTWESQALLRAPPIAGDPDLGRRFLELIDPLRWPAEGLTPRQVREIRTLKARMEAERLPRGADPKTHFKLGRGGLSDVEWTVQLLQMCHAHRVPGLRTTATLPALQAALDAGLVDPSHAEALRASWTLASRMRNAAICSAAGPSTAFRPTCGSPTASAGSWAASPAAVVSWQSPTGASPGGRGQLWKSTFTTPPSGGTVAPCDSGDTEAAGFRPMPRSSVRRRSFRSSSPRHCPPGATTSPGSPWQRWSSTAQARRWPPPRRSRSPCCPRSSGGCCSRRSPTGSPTSTCSSAATSCGRSWSSSSSRRCSRRPRWRCCSGCCSSSSSSADPPSRPTRCCSRTSSPTGGSTRVRSGSTPSPSRSTRRSAWPWAASS